ncbi:MAG: class I SAM-dependent methyltransferase [Cyanobacteria bacterium P01_H01_bin.130]
MDIGTGTGNLAIAAAHAVGRRGQVTGIDISVGMLEKARQKISAAAFSNVTLQWGDAETISYPDHTFDHILCANTFPWIMDKAATLQRWFRQLKPGGHIGIHTPADTAYVGPVLLQKILANYDISLEPSNRIGSLQQCHELFANAGFDALEIQTEQHGSYIPLDTVMASWETIMVQPSLTALQLSGDGIERLSPELLATIKAEFEAAANSLQTDQGVWNDLTTLYISGFKPKASLH